jgi:translation initiation factor IF-2
MHQTIEVINHAKAADVKILIALNKMDLPGVDINKIYSQLSEHELVPAEWGGDIEIVKTSAATGEGLDDLLEHLEYIAELLELKADDTVPAIGRVVEASISPQKGVVATLLVQEGILKKGDVVLAGKSYGRVKVIKNTFGKTIKSATSSTPVVVTGLDEVPQAGERFYCLGSDISKAKSVADENKMLSRESSLAKRTQITMENLFSQIEAGGVKELNIILRADVQGSVDVLVKYLNELSTEEVKIKILGATTGGITEGDVVLAEASNALLIGFNVIADERASRIAESKGVEIRLYTIIYRITEDLEKSMVGMLEPERHEELIGKATIRNTFKVSKLGTIAGCYVTDGVVRNKAAVHLIRNNVVVRNDLQMMSLKHFKDDVREVKTGLECGIKFTKFDDVKMDDMLEFYETVEVAKTLR